MNVERGIRRIVIALTVPMAVGGSALALYGYGRAYFVRKSLDANLFVDTPAPKLPKGYVLDKPSKSHLSDGIDFVPLWRDQLGQTPDLRLEQISELKGTGFIGVLLLGLSGILWVFFFVGRWVSLGFKE